MRLITIMLLAILFCGNLRASESLVTVTGGKIQGQILEDGMTVYKGIPYAAPPLGKLRWHAPMPVTPWSGVRDASEYAAPCAQVDSGWNHNSASIASEDCLFVNVWNAGRTSSELRPVMLWIHGGGNSGGSSLGLGGIEPSFDGADLARHGVVVATINYRLGIFGFFAHPELTSESPQQSSGNYALLDQIAALEWVQDNIEQFGGDPDNVTIFGQSAGGHDVGLLMTSPLAQGLYHKAIAQSGHVIIDGRMTPSLSDMEQSGTAVAEALGAPAEGQIEFLRQLPMAAIRDATPRGRFEFPLRPAPVVDGYVIPDAPAGIYVQGKEATVPLMIGNTARERRLGEDADALAAVREFYGPLAEQALDVYAFDDGEPAGSAYPPHGDGRALWATDTQFRCGAVMIAGMHSHVAPTYQYEFSHADGPRGASHSWELRYVFGNLLEDSSQATDELVSEQTQLYWTNFAKTGNPNDESLPDWPSLDTDRRYLDITSDGPIVRTGLRARACSLFEQRIRSKLAAAGGG